jgi:hypothetical protein
VLVSPDFIIEKKKHRQQSCKQCMHASLPKIISWDNLFISWIFFLQGWQLWKNMTTPRSMHTTSSVGSVRSSHGRMNYKDTKPNMSAFLSFDLLTDFAAFCLTDFIDWRYIHSWFVFSTLLVNCCPHGRRNYTSVLLPLYCTFSLTSSPLPPFPMYGIYRQCVTGGGGGG